MNVSTPAALKDFPSPAPDVRSRIGTLVAGRYRILRMIGEGGMGAVFEAEVLASGERVAVKLIKPEYATSTEVTGRFLQEVRAVSAVGHPNIVRLLDAGTDAHGPFMVLELLVGETLCDVLDRRPLGPREALAVMAATLDALQAAHTAGVVHRDIKPENIFLVGGVDRCTGVKLLDFGISKIISMQSATGGITRVGTAVGTPDYMSPEQAGGGRVDGRADLWSVGAVLYEAISLEHPFEGDSYQQLISNIVLHPHLPLRARVPAAPAEVEAFIDRALRKEPADRYGSAGEMLADARRLLSMLPSDESMGFRRDEPTSVMRAAPNEPTQVIEVRQSAASAGPARPQRQPRSAAPPPRPPPQQAHPNSIPGPPMPSWNAVPEATTLIDAPAHPSIPPSSPVAEDRGVPRGAITIAAIVAGALVFGALALRIRAATQDVGGPVAPLNEPAPTATQPRDAPPAPTAQVLAPSPTQMLAPSPTQMIAPSPTQVIAPSPAQVIAPPPPRAIAAPPPRARPGASCGRASTCHASAARLGARARRRDGRDPRRASLAPVLRGRAASVRGQRRRGGVLRRARARPRRPGPVALAHDGPRIVRVSSPRAARGACRGGRHGTDLPNLQVTRRRRHANARSSAARSTSSKLVERPVVSRTDPSASVGSIPIARITADAASPLA